MLEKYDETAECEARPIKMSLINRVNERISQLNKELAEQIELEELLKNNPEIERVLTLIGNIKRF